MSQELNSDTKQSGKLISRRGLLKATVRAGIGLSAFSLGSLEWAQHVEPGRIDVNPVALTLPNLSPAFDGLRLVQISDLHFDAWLTRPRLDHIVQLINRQQPDVVAITGDFLTFAGADVIHNLKESLSALRPRDGVVAVLGNHDHWHNAEESLRSMMKACGIIELRNTVHTLRRGGETLHLAGVDDAWVRQARMDDVLRQLPRTGAAILLAHEPDFADSYVKTGRFDLQLSGHTHGGQVTLPFIGPLILPPYGRKYASGLYRVLEMMVYTNRGVGMVQPYVRYNCAPEITVFTLKGGDTR